MGEPKAIVYFHNLINLRATLTSSMGDTQKQNYNIKSATPGINILGSHLHCLRLILSQLSLIRSDDAPEVETKQHFSNPLDFILMKEEYLKKNPPSTNPLSDQATGDSMASVMDSLKKMVKKINPKREFPNENKDHDEAKLRSMKRLSDLQMSQYEERMKKYQVNICCSKEKNMFTIYILRF